VHPSDAHAWLDRLPAWAEPRRDIIGIALVGSYARGTERPTSDIDLVLIADDTARYLANDAWLEEIGPPALIAVEDEDWGLLKSRRARYAGGLEVEWGVAPAAWCSIAPLDFGTAVVVAGGMRILHDPRRAFEALARAAPSVFAIRDVHGDPILARTLFREYAASLDVDLAFQSFEEELAGLPGDYVPPKGALIVAAAGEAIAGCAALHPWADDVGEIKRVFVRDAFRKKGIGRALAVEIIHRAKRAGYLRLRLDTLPRMQEAQALYRSLGFREITPYRANPILGSKYMELTLGTDVREARR
jgi:ribosomal protein S18 acetylase RimI-like enzyme/predicted nucleotidyltransferase